MHPDFLKRMTRAHVITGSFGSGKTTAIRRLMAGKPPDELWVVVLNEFTDAGIDALSVAQAASGSFDVRLVAGGCLCCVGELEFGKQLRDILRNLKPARLLVEPSGAGHAADIVDALGEYEAQGALKLDSIVCLIDALDAVRINSRRCDNDWAQIQSADVLLLSKPDLAGENERAAFEAIALAQYPAKLTLGSCLNGELPPLALTPHGRQPRFSLLKADDALEEPTQVPFEIGGTQGVESRVRQLGYWGVNWILPSRLTFARVVLDPRLRFLHEAHGSWLKRMKGVFRTGIGPSWLVQSSGHGLTEEDSAYRRDSRLELVLSAAPEEPFLEEWRRLLREAANV